MSVRVEQRDIVYKKKRRKKVATGKIWSHFWTSCGQWKTYDFILAITLQHYITSVALGSLGDVAHFRALVLFCVFLPLLERFERKDNFYLISIGKY